MPGPTIKKVSSLGILLNLESFRKRTSTKQNQLHNMLNWQ